MTFFVPADASETKPLVLFVELFVGLDPPAECPGIGFVPQVVGMVQNLDANVSRDEDANEKENKEEESNNRRGGYPTFTVYLAATTLSRGIGLHNTSFVRPPENEKIRFR